MGFAISPKELKTSLDKGDKLVLLDVREEWEYSLAKLDGSILIQIGRASCRERVYVLV